MAAADDLAPDTRRRTRHCLHDGCDYETDWGPAMTQHVKSAHSEGIESRGEPARPSLVSTPGDDDEGSTSSAPAPPESADTEEQRPQAPDEPMAEKAKGFLGRITAKKKDPPAKLVRSKGARQSTEALFESVWGFAGMGLLQVGTRPEAPNWQVPVGRVLQIQAPMVGPMLDEVVEGTFVDAPLQFLVRQSERGKLLGAIFGAPILVGILSNNPELAPQLLPLLRPLILTILTKDAEAAKKAKREEAKLTKALGDISQLVPPELVERAKADGIPLVDAYIMYAIFAPMPTPDMNGSAESVGANVA